MNQVSSPLFDEFIGLLIAVAVISIAVYVLYLVTLYNTLKKVSVHNRKMPPGQVFLMLIPLVSYVWQFLMAGYLADSIKAEATERGISTNEARPGYSLGIALGVLNLAALIPGVLGGLAGLANLVCWIIYWVKMAEYKKMLSVGAPVDENIEVLDEAL